MKVINMDAYKEYVNSVQSYNDTYRNHFMWKYYRNRMEMGVKNIDMIAQKLSDLCKALNIKCNDLHDFEINFKKKKEISELDETNIFFLLSDMYNILTELPMLLFSCTNELVKHNEENERELKYIMKIYVILKNTNEDMLTCNYKIHQLMQYISNKSLTKRYENSAKLKVFKSD